MVAVFPRRNCGGTSARWFVDCTGCAVGCAVGFGLPHVSAGDTRAWRPIVCSWSYSCCAVTPTPVDA